MKKFLGYLYTIIPLLIIAFLGYKYVKDPDTFLRKKDVEKAKAKIKDARQTVTTSKVLRRKASNEVMKVKAKANVRLSDLNTSIDNVKELEEINKIIESSQDARKLTVGDLLKRRTDG